MSVPASKNFPPRTSYMGTVAPRTAAGAATGAAAGAATGAASPAGAARPAGSSPAISQFRPGSTNPFQPTASAATAGKTAAPAPRDPKLALMAAVAELKGGMPPEAASKKLPAEKLFDMKAFQE